MIKACLSHNICYKGDEVMKLDRSTRRQIAGISTYATLKLKHDMGNRVPTKASARVGNFECIECGQYKEPRVRCNCGAW